MRVSIAQAKNRLAQLIQQAEKGELVTICRYGKPVVDRDWATPQNDIEK